MVVRDQLDHKKRANLTSIGTWREKYTELSIQDIHTFNHERGGKGPHNSQQHKLEKNTIEPYLQVFKSLAAMFHELANEENFFYVKSEKLRNRLKNAQPYLTHDGRVPTMIDLIEIFEGIQPVNKLYLESKTESPRITAIPKKPSDAVLKRIGLLGSEHFRNIQREEFLTAKEAWQLFKNQESIKIMPIEHLNGILDVFRGEETFTLDTYVNIGITYGRCPVLKAFKEMSDLPLDSEHVELIQEVELYVSYAATKKNKKFEMSVV